MGLELGLKYISNSKVSSRKDQTGEMLIKNWESTVKVSSKVSRRNVNIKQEKMLI